MSVASTSNVSSGSAPCSSPLKTKKLSVVLNIFIMKFTKTTLELHNCTTEENFSSSVTLYDNTKQSLLTTQAFLVSDTIQFVEAIKKVKSVYAGIFSEPITVDHSVLTISSTTTAITTSGDCLAVHSENVGKLCVTGDVFLRNCLRHQGVAARSISIDATVPMEGLQPKKLLQRYILPSEKEAVFKFARTNTDIVVVGTTTVRLIDCRVRSVRFYLQDGVTECEGTVIVEGRTVITHPKKIRGKVLFT